MRRLLAIAALALAAAPGALAGGWATVGLTPLPPDDIQAGDAWTPQVTVLRHGRTPTDGAAPSITISSGADTTTIPLEPAGKTGLYSARVVFPHAGTWSYAIDNGLAATGYGGSQTTTYEPIVVGSGTSGGFALPGGWATGAATAMMLAMLAAWQVLRRLRAPNATTQSGPQGTKASSPV